MCKVYSDIGGIYIILIATKFNSKGRFFPASHLKILYNCFEFHSDRPTIR